jgi:hypothetical protein
MPPRRESKSEDLNEAQKVAEAHRAQEKELLNRAADLLYVHAAKRLLNTVGKVLTLQGPTMPSETQSALLDVDWFVTQDTVLLRGPEVLQVRRTKRE